MEEIQLTREQYCKIIVGLGIYNESDIKSGRAWADSCITDEKLGLEYVDTTFKTIEKSCYYENAAVFNFKIIDPKRWCYAKLKYTNCW